ncbi:MAG: urease subunit gamma [Thermomicrobiales bacterium]|nr:urease subunit gamma [Thermomicrobiales bacterium]
MALTPKETDRLLVFTAAELARKHRARGLLLNYPEAVALVTDEIFDAARAGMAFDAVVEHAQQVLRRSDVMEGVPEMLGIIQVDAMFPDGTRLVTVLNPIRKDEA